MCVCAAEAEEKVNNHKRVQNIVKCTKNSTMVVDSGAITQWYYIYALIGCMEMSDRQHSTVPQPLKWHAVNFISMMSPQ